MSPPCGTAPGLGAEGKEGYFSFSANQAQVHAAINITTTSITISLLLLFIVSLLLRVRLCKMLAMHYLVLIHNSENELFL